LFFFRPKRKHVDVIVVGLGNPGPKYARSRHNLGFAVIERLARNWSDEARWQTASHYFYIEGKREGKAFLIVKPSTFMNLSGNAIRKVARKYDLEPEKLIVVHDDLDVAYGKVKMKFAGSPAGHRGVNSIAGRLGTMDFHHIKMGIGLEGIKGGEHYVLGQLTDDEWAEFEPAIDLACKGLDVFLTRGPAEAQQYINTHGKMLVETQENRHPVDES
jgi:PTH1 family peptidyl-tRNA hydrolase